MIVNLKKAFKDMLGTNDWMDDETKLVAGEKVTTGHTPPNKFRLVFMSILFLKISAIQKSKEMLGLTGIFCCDWTPRLDI